MPTYLMEYKSKDGDLIIFKVQHNPNNTEQLRVTHSVTVHTDLSWSIQVHGKTIDKPSVVHLRVFL